MSFSFNHKEYELFIQTLHQKILQKEGFENMNVQHNVKVKGCCTEHQIDVFWNQKLEDGSELKVCVECKQWNSKVTQGDLLKFKGVLDDIGNAKGIFVTTKGFQAGAKKVAEFYGVELICANIDIKEYNSRLEISFNTFKNFNFIFESCTGKKRKIIDSWTIKQQNKAEPNPFIYNSQKKRISNFKGFIENIQNEHKDIESRRYSLAPVDSYVKIRNELYQINKIEYEYIRIHNPMLDLHAVNEIATIVADYIFDKRKEIFHINKD